MSKTIKQIADEIGVTKQAVRDKIAKLGLQSTLQKDGNQFVITNQQENLIRQAFSERLQSETESTLQSKPKSIDKEIYDTFQPILDTLRLELDILNNQLSVKDRQMEIKDKQIEDLSSQLLVKDKLIEDLNIRLSEAHQLTNNAQSLHVIDKGNEYTQQLITDEEPQKEKTKKQQSFWSRIFGNKENEKEE